MAYTRFDYSSELHAAYSRGTIPDSFAYESMPQPFRNADILGRSTSTISCEVSRNKRLLGYRPNQAYRLEQERRRAKYSKQISDEAWQWVYRLLLEDWNPEQISR